MKPIEVAVKLVGGQKALASKIAYPDGKKVQQGHVWNWIHRGTPVTDKLCIPIEEATAGAVTRYDLRPDVFGEAPVKSKKVKAA